MRSKNWIYPLILVGLVLMFANSCKKDDNKNNNTPTGQIPVLTTTAVTNINQTNANCGGNITNDGGTTVTVRGVCWSTNQTPTIANSKSTDGTGAGIFTSSITGLIANTNYYVRAYASNSAGTGYGSAMSFTTQPLVSDIDGNMYHTVTIGTQVWMVENLKTTKYRDGTSIPNVTDNNAWHTLTTGAYCDYDNTPSNSATYGKLYNWNAVANFHELAPTGWHVPTSAEWTTLITSLGGQSFAGGKLKEIGTTHWTTPNTGATNESGFTALSGGSRSIYGNFEGIGLSTGFWSATKVDATYSRMFYTNYMTSSLYGGDYSKEGGFSIRCIKD